MNSEINGFSNNPFMIGYDNKLFEGDNGLGFRFPEGKLITSTSFSTLDDIIVSIKSRLGFPNLGYPIILNIGDSSTSGWNSNNVFRGNLNPLVPFFSYKTYSQLMEEKLFASVINAGVPGYSSYQGKRFLEYLLRRIIPEGIILDYVTLYFGNNDGTYNQYEDKVRIDGKKSSYHSVGERVTTQDFEKNINDMIQLCREYDIKPIIIVPPVRYFWEPGIRSQVHRTESIEILEKLGDCQLANELQYARDLYQHRKYALACEIDRVLPRLKYRYRKALIHVAKVTKTDHIDVQNKISLDAEDYFVDYCHPIEQTNQMIIDAFQKIRMVDLRYKSTLRQRLSAFFSSGSQGNGSPPSNIYAGII
ncbi:MAG: GDSL-type esterase/lipase family protein [Candidatus Woesearchaeota archaeon]|jgi:lysophospholipase L1-like esterase